MHLRSKSYFRFSVLLLTSAALVFALPAPRRSPPRISRPCFPSSTRLRPTSTPPLPTFSSTPMSDRSRPRQRHCKKARSTTRGDGNDFQMAAHIIQENDKPVPKIYTYSKGVFQLYEKLPDQVTTYKNDKVGGYLLLGFGASGKSSKRNGISPTPVRRSSTA